MHLHSLKCRNKLRQSNVTIEETTNGKDMSNWHLNDAIIFFFFLNGSMNSHKHYLVERKKWAVVSLKNTFVMLVVKIYEMNSEKIGRSTEIIPSKKLDRSTVPLCKSFETLIKSNKLFFVNSTQILTPLMRKCARSQLWSSSLIIYVILLQIFA